MDPLYFVEPADRFTPVDKLGRTFRQKTLADYQCVLRLKDGKPHYLSELNGREIIFI